MNYQSSEEEIKKAYKVLEESDAQGAKEILANALELDLENKEINFAHWCCSFWADYITKISQLQSTTLSEIKAKGEGLINKWESFKELLEREKKEKNIQPRAVLATQRGVFTLALKIYLEAEKKSKEDSQQKDSYSTSRLQKHDAEENAEIQRMLGLCYKELGEYETALNHLVQANTLHPASPKVLAEMADCFALCGEEKNAKVLFREAFFLDAQKISTIFLESELILCLIKQVKEKGYTGSALLEWIPVYGILYGVFNVKRQLKPQEVSKLKQDIYAKENELKDPTNNAQILTPKIINMYFWLIDHYSRSNDGYVTNEIKNCELQIRVLDEEVYKLYKNK
ncbi:MAG: hypothetical protein K6B43_09205 [Treponema sp.]|nr:hypothetical protein [Treponema sp.]